MTNLKGLLCGVALALAPGLAGSAESPGPMMGFDPETARAQRDLETRFDAGLSAADQRAWLEQMSSAPNHVGSPHVKANAEFMLAKFKEWGWDARIETFDVLYPTPKEVSLEMTKPAARKFTLVEGPVEGDRTSDQTAAMLPPYNAYGADGDVTASLVYVNYGMPEDYEALARMGVSVKGKIAIARYGGGWRGLKPKLAYEHGAVACLIYSDPGDDGYGPGEPYPAGPTRPSQGVQRGSVADMPIRPGDPLTPNVGATKGASRLSREKSEVLMKIPVMPISYGDAQNLLAALGGPVAPEGWRGQLPITYHVGPGPTEAHIVIRSDWSLKTINNVVAVLRGSQYPDQWVVRGNHHDGWVFGAADPLSGNVALLAEAKAIGELAKTGWRPKRTLVYASWDGEEPGLLGSTEWVEQHADELQRKAIAYVNTDGNSRGFLQAGGSHGWQSFLNDVAREVKDPETGASVRERLRARRQVVGFAKGASEEERELAEDAAKGGDLRISSLGSGSDYTAFQAHLGVASMNLGYGGEDDFGGEYHSAYDSFDHYIRFGDPTMAYGVALSQTVGRVVLRLANASVIPYSVGDFTQAISRFAGEVHKLADDRRKRGDTLERLLKTDAFKLAADPTKVDVPPPAEEAVPFLEFAAFDNAVSRLEDSAKAFGEAYAATKAKGPLSAAQEANLNSLFQAIDQSLLYKAGLPRRPWFRNLIYAPGMHTGYAPKTLPGVREGIEEKEFADANRYAAITATVLTAYAARIDKATAALK